MVDVSDSYYSRAAWTKLNAIATATLLRPSPRTAPLKS